MDAKEIHKKIEHYEKFIEENLKKDLKEVELILKGKVEEHNNWEEVKTAVKIVNEFKEKDRDMLVRVNLGSDVMVSGEVTDFERLYINIGLGYLLELDSEETNKYSDIRMKVLKKEIEHFRKMAVDIKVHIKLVLLAINELQTTLL